MKTQKFCSSNSLTCNDCKRYFMAKSSSFKCLSCNKILCLPCEKKHDKKHQVINYEEINYICNIHNGIYNKYCINCKKNICINCEKDHINHKCENFKDIFPDKEMTLKEIQNLKKTLDQFKWEIKAIITKLDKIIDYFEIYYQIFNELAKSFYDMKYKNYKLIKNINEFKKYNNVIEEDIKKITNNQALEELIKLYDKINENNNYIMAEIMIDENNKKDDIRIIN